MKSFVLFILTTFIVQLSVVGQKRYELDLKEKTLSDAIEVLSDKYRFKFSYNPKALKGHLINRTIKTNSEADLISEIFEDLPFKIQLSDGIYLLIPKKIEAKSNALAGKIFDKNTGKPLAYAHVKSTDKGAISNQNGRFTLPPREDTITVEVSYIGYKDIQLTVPPSQEDITLDLEQNPLMLQEVILSSPKSNQTVGNTSFFSLNPEQFNALPTLGETDVFKSIQLLPGVKATDETSSGLAVRGSLPSQNLVMMDGFTLYHLDHFFGIFSTLNPNVIDNVSIYKGGFGPEYGGRVSSVVDVAGKVGSSDTFSGGAGLNMLSLNGFIETPIGDKSSLLMGGRRSFTDLVNSDLYQDFLTSNRQGFLTSVDPGVASLDLLPSFHFYDFNSKFRHQFNSKSSLDVNLYLSEDFYQGDFFEKDDFSSVDVSDQANWSSIGLSVGLKNYFNPNWFSDLTISASQYADNERLEVNQTILEDASFGQDSISANTEINFFDYNVESSVGDFTIRSQHEIRIDNQNSLKAGIELSSISTFYQADQLFLIDFVSDTIVSDTLDTTAGIMSLYTGYQFGNGDLTSNVGIRGSYYEPTEKWYVEPRFDLRFRVNDKLHLKSAASYHHQFVNQTSLSVFQNTDQFYWVLADDDVIPVQKASHLIVGADYSFNKWTIDLEYYRKSTKGVIENQFLNLAPEVLSFIQEEDLNLSGENNSQGIDVFLKYRTNTFTSWLSYSLGESTNQFWYRNENSPYPSEQDQRHEINLVNSIKLGKWELSSILIYGSGQPYTPPNPDVEGESFYDLSRINTLRLPDYSRFDLSAKYSFPISSLKAEAGITLFNLFGAQNIKSRRYTKQFFFNEDASNQLLDEDEIRIVALDTYLLGFTPNFFFNISF